MLHREIDMQHLLLGLEKQPQPLCRGAALEMSVLLRRMYVASCALWVPSRFPRKDRQSELLFTTLEEAATSTNS